MIHQTDSENVWLLLSANFTPKFGLVFVLTLENAISYRFYFKTNGKSIGSSKMVPGIFKIILRLQDRHAFKWQSVEILNVFNTLTLKGIFWKTKNFLKELEYLFLVESTKIGNASFLNKSVMSEANAKTNRMVSTKWTYHKDRSFASNYFIFLKVLLQFKSLL